MGWWCEVRGELTSLIAAPPWLLPSTSQQAGCSCRPGLIEVSWPPSLQRTAKCPACTPGFARASEPHTAVGLAVGASVGAEVGASVGLAGVGAGEMHADR